MFEAWSIPGCHWLAIKFTSSQQQHIRWFFHGHFWVITELNKVREASRRFSKCGWEDGVHHTRHLCTMISGGKMEAWWFICTIPYGDSHDVKWSPAGTGGWRSFGTIQYWGLEGSHRPFSHLDAILKGSAKNAQSPLYMVGLRNIKCPFLYFSPDNINHPFLHFGPDNINHPFLCFSPDISTTLCYASAKIN